MQFTTIINEFLRIDPGIDVEATVTHKDGKPFEISIPFEILPYLKANANFTQYITDAAINNHQSMSDEGNLHL